ncbi:MAG TPA: amidohydrolase family protein [Candidatus Acidoferrales bacterium]|nr:amidohydrolase family protein [Candidatus Acidoferrales bacterium]
MRIIDADGHVHERNIPWEELLAEPYRARAPKRVKDNRGVEFVMLEGRLCPKPVGKGCGFVGAPRSRRPQPTTGMQDPAQRLKDMDLEGIDTAVLFGTSPFLSLPFVEDKDLACAIAEAYNNWLAGYCKTDPKRLKGVVLAPIQDPPAAASELRRCVKELGFVAVATPAHSASGKNLDHPDLEPFFAEAERLDVPVCVHVGAGDGTAAGIERFDHPFFTHAMAHPFEQMIAVLCVVVGGVMEKFPRLKFAFMEAGAGWVPYWIERLDEHYEYLRPTVPWLTRPPGEYMRGGRLYYAFEPDEKTIPYVAEFVGEDCLIFASDYNHSDSKFPDTVKSVTSRNDIPPALMAKIMGGNAARLYSI